MEIKFTGTGEAIMVIDNFLSKEECEELIDFCEGRNKWCQAATVGNDGKPKYSDYRSNIQTAVPFGSELDTFLHGVFSKAVNEYGRRHNIGGDLTDEAYRVLKYNPGQKYGVHMDCSDKNPRVISSLIYLNSTEKGGQTTFPSDSIEIMPEAGRLIMFPSNFLFWHEAKPVEKGVKYAVVTFFNYKSRIKK